jgi:ribosome-associated protein
MPSTSNSPLSDAPEATEAPLPSRLDGNSPSPRDSAPAHAVPVTDGAQVPAGDRPGISGAELSLRIADAAASKKAEDIVVLDLRGISTFTEFYVICSGGSEPQLKAIVDEIQDALRKELNLRARRVDGFPYSQWVVADFGDVVVHVFHESKRQHYALEDLWSDAPRLTLPEAVAAGGVS